MSNTLPRPDQILFDMKLKLLAYIHLYEKNLETLEKYNTSPSFDRMMEDIDESTETIIDFLNRLDEYIVDVQ